MTCKVSGLPLQLQLPCILFLSCWQVQELPLLIAYGAPLLAIVLFRAQVRQTAARCCCHSAMPDCVHVMQPPCRRPTDPVIAFGEAVHLMAVHHVTTPMSVESCAHTTSSLP